MNYFDTLYAFLSAFYIGFFIISGFAKNTPLAFRTLFAIPAGFGLTSILYFLFMVLNIYNFGVFRSFEFVTLVLSAIFYYFKNEQQPLEKIKLSIPLTLSSLFGVLIYLRYYLNNTMGSWDGFRIWNIKAQFLFQNNESWKNVFLMPHFMMHNDYPLFLPSSSARLWKYAGVDSCDLNMVLGLIFTLGTVYLVYFALKHFKNSVLASMSASILVLLPVFLTNGAAQSADIPLAFMILCSVVSLFLYFERKNKDGTFWMILSAFFAGLSAWTKNEGLMYLLVFSIVCTAYFLYQKEYKNILKIFLTTLPFVILLCIFKSVSKAQNDLYTGVILLKTYSHLFNVSYYFYIIKYLFIFIFKQFSLLFLFFLMMINGFEIKKAQQKPLILCGIMFLLMCAGYFTVYLLSPHVLKWLLTNSLDRIMLQITPLFIFLLSLTLKMGDAKD